MIIQSAITKNTINTIATITHSYFFPCIDGGFVNVLDIFFRDNKKLSNQLTFREIEGKNNKVHKLGNVSSPFYSKYKKILT
jgi:hypothetical protein